MVQDMSRKKKVKAKVVSQKQIADQIFDLWLETELARDAHAGQFIAVYPHNASTLLPRPISICEVDRAAKQTSSCISHRRKRYCRVFRLQSR